MLPLSVPGSGQVVVVAAAGGGRRGGWPMAAWWRRQARCGWCGADAGRDGDGLLGAAGRGMLRGLQDLRPVPVQEHRRGAERAADLAHGGGALDPVVAVGIVGGEAAELVAGQLAGLAVVVGGLLCG